MLRIHFDNPGDIPTTDVGFLLEKHPARIASRKVSAGVGMECAFNEGQAGGLWMTTLAHIDPIELARGGTQISDYVSDHAYSASPLFWVGFSQMFRSALHGQTRGDQALLGRLWSVQVEIPAIWDDGDLVWSFFDPLGYTVKVHPVLGRSDGRISSVRLVHAGIIMQTLFQQLYVLGRAVDGRKYHKASAETVDKLVREAGGWILSHPQYRTIARRFVGHRPAGADAIRALEAQQSTAPDEPVDTAVTEEDDVSLLLGEDDEEAPSTEDAPDMPSMEDEEPGDLSEGDAPPRPKLVEERRRWILDRVLEYIPIQDPENPPLLVEIGCGRGELAERLAQAGYRVLGIDQNVNAIRRAVWWARHNGTPRVGFECHNAFYALLPIREGEGGKIQFAHPPRKRGAVESADDEADAPTPTVPGLPIAGIICTEVIEHVNPGDLDDFWRALLEQGVSTVVLTTPNRMFNPLYGIEPGAFRDRDHKFEWTRAELTDAVERQEELRADLGLDVEMAGIGPTAMEFRSQAPPHPTWEGILSGQIGDREEAEQVPPLACPTYGVVFQIAHPRVSSAIPQTPHLRSDFTVSHGPRTVIPWTQRVSATSFLAGVAPSSIPYLPPTMCPCDAAETGPLETVEAALRYYAAHGVTEVVLEEKHMGSRALAWLPPEGDGELYSRMGRPFSFPEKKEILATLRRRIRGLGWSWALIDSELLPWGAKAHGLIRSQFESTGTALLARAAALNDIRMRQDAEAFLRVLWMYEGADQPVRCAPFAVLARGPEMLESAHAPTSWTHRHQMVMTGLLLDGDISGCLQSTAWLEASTSGEDDETATAFYNTLVARGAEGVVVKPMAGMAALTESGVYVQPGIKVRNPEYLRIIYGPRYLQQIDRLRQRRTKGKRRLALQQHALGMAALRELQAQQGRVTPEAHQCIFGILALELEPMDPRL